MADGQVLQLKVRSQDGNELTFKIFNAYCTKSGLEQDLMRFVYDQQRLRAEETPADHDMEDGDVIDVMRSRQAARCSRRKPRNTLQPAPRPSTVDSQQLSLAPHPMGSLCSRPVVQHETARIDAKPMAAEYIKQYESQEMPARKPAAVSPAQPPAQQQDAAAAAAAAAQP
ncbi:small ubiquitin-related modifier 1-like isoform A [Chlorella sorokiniana]|uniref:Small ubiquitin-related modifier 1-like isoform A n=1 Tax=Chlorella sorokiniana TaxID=3076 RepID=A0A2P6TD44_CHLSO|nr:small ubiquitin-related modifier 1-like isoform A [Chlorella sorokiniana]|eukprot:PRW20567.1 small ubiquitin-related modifier 1-like isoform A [Chlorella sorokiniana]